MPNFFYTEANGQKRGPINDQQLKALAARGVITPHTPMETDTGHKGLAGQIPGLFVHAPPLPSSQPPRVQTEQVSATVKKIIKEFRHTDFKSEIVPIDESNLSTLLKDSVFWAVLALGVLPLLIVSLHDINMQFTGLLFFFAMLWGGVFRGGVMKSNDKIILPIGAFFFTGCIGMPLLLFSFELHPEFYLTLTDHDDSIFQLIGCISHTGVWEEICKILPVIAYIAWKRKNAQPLQPLMIILIGVFSGLGFAAFENISYGEQSMFRAVGLASEHGVAGVVVGTQVAMINVMLRSISLVFAHALWTGIFSYYLTIAVLSGSRWFVLGFLGLAVPAVLHGTYNWLCGVQPVFAALVVVASFVLFYGYLAKLRQITQ